MIKSFFILLVLPEAFGFLEMESDAVEFGYDETKLDGPANWRHAFRLCGGEHQSPIKLDIGTSSYIAFHPLKLMNFKSKPKTVNVQNHVSHVSVEFEYDNSSVRPFFIGGPLIDEKYIVTNIHLHWGEDDSTGSEHIINGESYAAELQIIAYKDTYRNLQSAMHMPDGLAIISILCESSEESTVDGFFVYLSLIAEPSFAITLEEEDIFTLHDLVGAIPPYYYSYKGSLTMPPCYQSVTWIVMNTPLNVDAGYIAELSNLKDYGGKRIAKNHRPTQSIENRFILRNF